MCGGDNRPGEMPVALIGEPPTQDGGSNTEAGLRSMNVTPRVAQTAVAEKRHQIIGAARSSMRRNLVSVLRGRRPVRPTIGKAWLYKR